jgi:hypothetical protein
VGGAGGLAGIPELVHGCDENYPKKTEKQLLAQPNHQGTFSTDCPGWDKNSGITF